MFSHPIQVRYLEVGQQGVVFNMWYLAYFDDAMTAFLAHNGLGYGAMLAAGFDVQLVHVDIDWSAGVRFGEPLVVEVRLVRRGATSFTLGFGVRRNGESCAEAKIVYVCVATDGSGKRTLPELLAKGLGSADSDAA